MGVQFALRLVPSPTKQFNIHMPKANIIGLCINVLVYCSTVILSSIYNSCVPKTYPIVNFHDFSFYLCKCYYVTVYFVYSVYFESHNFEMSFCVNSIWDFMVTFSPFIATCVV